MKITKSTENKIAIDELGNTFRLQKNGEYIKKDYTTNDDGYVAISVRISGKPTVFKTHRLVAEAFIPNPANLPIVNHINGNKQDNRVVNLEWVTAKGNLQHASLNGLLNTNNKRKLSFNEIFDIHALHYVLGHSKRSISKVCNIPLATVLQLLKGTRREIEHNKCMEIIKVLKERNGHRC